VKGSKKHARKNFDDRMLPIGRRPCLRAMHKGRDPAYCVLHTAAAFTSPISASRKFKLQQRKRPAGLTMRSTRGAQLDLPLDSSAEASAVLASLIANPKRALGIQGPACFIAARLSSPRACCQFRHSRISERPRELQQRTRHNLMDTNMGKSATRRNCRP